MRRVLFGSVIIFLVSCNGNKTHDVTDSIAADSIHTATDTTTLTVASNFDAANYSKLKNDSLRYLFDRYDKDHNYHYTIQSLKVKRLGNEAIFQGDIILESNVPDNSRMERVKIDTLSLGVIKSLKKIQMVGVDALSTDRMWPGGVINYMISTYGETGNLQANITSAIDAWKATGLKFNKITSVSGDYVVFEAKTDYVINASPLGKIGGKQLIKLRPDASVGNIIHEIGHSLGLWHEHSRPDRDQFITIQGDNIDPNCKKEFDLIQDKYSFYGTTYDFGSIMHYDAYAFAKTGLNGQKLITIKTKPPGQNIGQRTGLSSGDREGIKKMYHL